VEATPGYSGAHYAVVAALSWQGVKAPWILKGSRDRTAFEAYIQYHLRPTLRPGDIVLIDNLSAHTGEVSRQLLKARGAHLEFLRPYSFDLDPIELCWAKVKGALRAAKARTFEALVDALAKALRSVTRIDSRAWFAPCGYLLS